jgi:hypothetical protein
VPTEALRAGAHSRLRLRRLLLAAVVLGSAVSWLPPPASAQQGVPATQCWRGWGYLLDGDSGGYKSGEMLLVTIGTTVWEAGHPVELFLLDRASGLLSDMPSITIVPDTPRLYYRGRLNYVDAKASIAGSGDRIVIGLSHIEPAKPGVPAKERYNRWACGFPED